jgi:hypothetical protein
MDVLDGISDIPPGRWKLRCSVCSQVVGACIQCAVSRCATAFHPMCALRAEYRMEVRETTEHEDPTLLAYCKRHADAVFDARVKPNKSVLCMEFCSV